MMRDVWSKKDKLMFSLAIIAFVVGIGLSIAGFIVAPSGIIDASVLGFTGEAFTFTGAVLGIGEYGYIQTKKIDKAMGERN